MFQRRKIGQPQGGKVISLRDIAPMPAFGKRPQITV